LGIILKSKNRKECNDVNLSRKTNFIDITNWRYIRYVKEKNYIITCIPPLREVLIRNMNIEEFHEINYCSKTIFASYDFTVYVSVCHNCFGSGKSDWVSSIMKKPRKFNIICEGTKISNEFQRNPKGEILETVSIIYPHETIYVSSPMKTKYEEVCKYCYGSGSLLIGSKVNVVKKFILDYC